MKEYRKESWIDPRLEVRPSRIGQGVFAREPIKAGEVVTIWGGTVYPMDQFNAGTFDDDTDCQIDEAHVIANPKERGQDPDDFVNHSCDPNLWMKDEVTVQARRDIAAGEELTADYGTWITEPDYVLIERCLCGSPFCRGRITGDDWKLPAFQKTFKGHVAPYLTRRMPK